MKLKTALAALVLMMASAALLRAQAATDVPPPALPDGTAIQMRLDETMTTFTHAAGQPFTGKVAEAVSMDGRQIIPAGATIEGHITQVSEPRRINGLPRIGLRPEYIVLPDGTRYVIRAVVVDTSTPKTLKVDDEGFILGSSTTKADVAEVGAGVGGGAAIGAVTGGPVGAAVGATIGGGATLTHRLMKHHYARIPAGTILWLELRRPMDLVPAPAPVPDAAKAGQ